MPLAIVTGSGGLVGSESVRRLVEDGYEVIGRENDMRARLFGPDASRAHVTETLVEEMLTQIHDANAERWAAAGV